jgi:hypothetical protein
MDKEKILKIGKELQGKTTISNFYARQAEIKNIIQVYGGKNNPFYEAAEKIKITAPYAESFLNNLIDSFLRSVENDLISNVSFERKIKNEVVNDFLEQAQDLLELQSFHPGAAAALVGASLEEFLRNWALDENLNIDGQLPSIDRFATMLKKAGLITKQDYKEIGVWAGYRNDAAHGNWEAVKERDKITMMLKGVAIFIKQYSK